MIAAVALLLSPITLGLGAMLIGLAVSSATRDVRSPGDLS